VFVHVLDAAVTTLTLPPIGARVSTAAMLATGDRVPVADAPTGLTITLPAASPTDYDRVVVFETVR
jgi:hypothetical protein